MFWRGPYLVVYIMEGPKKLSYGRYLGGPKCFRGSPNFTVKYVPGGSIFLEKLVPGGTNFEGSIFAVTGPIKNHINV